MDMLTRTLIDELRECMEADRIQSAYDYSFRRSKHLALYGCGFVAQQLHGAYSEAGINIDCFCESEGGAHIGQTINGTPCISFNELLLNKSDTTVLVANGDTLNSYRHLRAYGFPYVCCVPHFHFQHLDWLKSTSFADIEPVLRRVLAVLGDQRSTEVLLTVLVETFRFDQNIERIARLCEPDAYFPPAFIRLSAAESFVDVGAFDGSTIKEFASRTEGKYQAIHAFEMSEDNYHMLLKNVDGMQNLNTYNLGLSDAKGGFQYVESGMSAHGANKCSRGGARQEIKTAKLERMDSALSNERVTFIKMDVEGGEVEALKGAEQIIRAQKPACAICVYHNPAHILEIPQLLLQWVPNYRIFYRHHTQLLYETICYAVF